MTDEKIPRDELAKLPHLDIKDIGGRHVPMMPVLLNDEFGKWGLWVLGPANKLVRLKVGELTESSYFGKEMDRDDDVYFHFLHVATQHLLYEELNDIHNALRNDVLNIAGSLTGLRILHLAGLRDKANVRRAAQVQLEYIIMTCRQMFDLAQEFLGSLHRRIQWKDAALEKKRRERKMPRSFAEVSIKAHERAYTKEEIAESYGLSDPWLDFYVKHAPFLFRLRRLRDRIVHKGDEAPLVGMDERGFLIRAADVQDLYTFPKPHMHPTNPNGFGAFLSLIAYIINSTLKMLEDLATMVGHVTLKPPIAPGYYVFMRDPHLHVLGEGELPVLPSDDPWYHHPEEGKSS